MNNISLPIIFLVLAAVVFVFGIGVVVLNRRKPATPVVQRATPITKTAVVEKVLEEVVVEEAVEEVVAVVVKASVRDRLSKARSAFGGAVTSVLTRSEISDTTWDELEEALLRADVGVRVAQELMQPLRARVKSKEIVSPQQLIDALRQDMSAHLVSTDRELRFDATIEGPNIWLMVGVNGAGKTTSIGKISAQQTALGRTVMMAAGDTFRAAAGEQLATWAERSGAEIIRGAEGGDPSSVIFDAVQAANARNIDLVLADTAGRLQSNTNLMEELRKVRRVAEKGAGTVTEVLLVIDATTGQNGLSQARVFAEATQVTGIVLTKLDGSAKGGIVFAIETELGIPIKLVLLCNRPAVSASTKSMLRAFAACTASKMTDDGSPPSAPRIISAPERSAHVASCSPAAARNVSPAAIITVRPSAVCCAEIFPMLVVLPAPLTPTINQMFGPSMVASKRSSRSVETKCALMSWRNASISCCGDTISLLFTRVRNGCISSCATRTPTSARNSASSSSSHVVSEISLRVSTDVTAPPNALRALDNLSRTLAFSTTATTSSTAAASSTTTVLVIGVARCTTGAAGLRRFSQTTPKPKTKTTTANTKKMMGSEMLFIASPR